MSLARGGPAPGGREAAEPGGGEAPRRRGASLPWSVFVAAEPGALVLTGIFAATGLVLAAVAPAQAAPNAAPSD